VRAGESYASCREGKKRGRRRDLTKFSALNPLRSKKRGGGGKKGGRMEGRGKNREKRRRGGGVFMIALSRIKKKKEKRGERGSFLNSKLLNRREGGWACSLKKKERKGDLRFHHLHFALREGKKKGKTTLLSSSPRGKKSVTPLRKKKEECFDIKTNGGGQNP